VTATNSQTQVRVEELNARASAERHVEKFFAATEPPRNLLYERRSKQYENKGDVVKARVIDRYTLVRATAATFADEAHLSTGYPMQLLGRLAGARRGEDSAQRVLLFGDADEPVVYYAAASGHYRLDLFFKTSRLEAKYKPARWHLLMVARHRVGRHQWPGAFRRGSQGDREVWTRLVQNCAAQRVRYTRRPPGLPNAWAIGLVAGRSRAPAIAQTRARACRSPACAFRTVV
jgi:hypothetical protein